MKLNKKTLRRLIKEELSRAVEAQRQSEAAGAGYWSGQFRSNSTRGDALETGQLMQLQMILDGRSGGPNYMDIARKVNAKNLADMVNGLAAWAGRGEEVAAAVLGGANATSLGGGKDPAAGLSKPLRMEAAGSAEAIARLKRQRELEAGGMGHAQAKRVPAAEEADADLAALWAWIQKNAPEAASSAMSALRGGAGPGEHWTGGLNPGSPESDAGVFPEGFDPSNNSLTSLFDAVVQESIDLARAQQVEAKLKGFGMDEKTAWTVTNDLLNAASGFAHAANKSGMLTDDMVAEITAAGDVSDEILQQIAGGGVSDGEPDGGGGDWETAWSEYSGSPAGTRPAMQSDLHAGEDS